VTAAELSRALGRPVRGVERRAADFASSFVLEELEVTGADGAVERLIAKDAGTPTRAGAAAKPAELLDPARELAAYREVLGPWDIGAPALRGVVGEHVLLLEAIDGVPLWQAGDLALWEEAARWLARLHSRPAPSAGPPFVRYDATLLRGWLARARPLTGHAALDPVEAVWDAATARLAAWPTAFIHGDFYPQNVLVAGGRIRPVDWELAGVGPGLLDLAALVSGDWGVAERARIVAAYAGAYSGAGLVAGEDELAEALDDARLLVAVQWLGWSRGWSPPPEHAHDWLADALCLAARIAR
jgi:aminoglycoside phosphotransferase (APT) family kinase protein